MNITASTNFSNRAAQLLGSLPNEGASELRREHAREAVDTLIHEFSRFPEANIGRLVLEMARPTKVNSVAENAYRAGLEAAAAGLTASGASLAGLSLKILKQTPEKEQLDMRTAACYELSNRQDLNQVMRFEPVFKSLPTKLCYTESEIDRAHEILLTSASRGDSKAATAGSLLAGLPGDRRGRENRLTKELISRVSADSHGQEAWTYRLAEKLTSHWLTDNSFARLGLGKAFLTDTPHTASGRAQRLRNSQIDNVAKREGLGELARELRANHNQAWKYLELGQHLKAVTGPPYGDAGVPAAAMNLALEKVGDLPKNVTPQDVAGYLSEVSALRGEGSDGSCASFYSGSDCLLSVTDRVREMLPEGSWQASLDVLVASRATTYPYKDKFPVGTLSVLSKLADLPPGYSPLLATCQALATATRSDNLFGEDYLHQDRLFDLLALAQCSTSKSAEVEALRQATGRLKEGGPTAVAEYLQTFLK